MKQLLLISAILVSSVQLIGQRFAYVDSRYILENMEEYQEAQKELNAISKQWQETVEAKIAELDEMKRTFEAEKILLTDEMRKERLTQIKEKDKEVKDYQRAKFGVKGELFTRRQELIKPLQDEIYNAIKELASERSYGIVFDKGVNTNILFSDPKYDKSDVILKKLGYSARDE
ncbi:MAG TPA: hypothetical protein DDX92_10560 [Flavobacteriales bacterium]|jgi:outer membrane protein|nr:hypothetical protein [Flavobacteriales bacterium]